MKAVGKNVLPILMLTINPKKGSKDWLSCVSLLECKKKKKKSVGERTPERESVEKSGEHDSMCCLLKTWKQ